MLPGSDSKSDNGTFQAQYINKYQGQGLSPKNHEVAPRTTNQRRCLGPSPTGHPWTLRKQTKS